MKFINNDFVSREYYEGACAYYQNAITQLTEENKLYETKLRKITGRMELLKTVLNDYDDIYRAIIFCGNVASAFSKITDKLGRILDDYEMF